MAVDFNLDNLTPEMIEETAQSFINLGTLRDLKGITDEEMEAIYSMGFSFYNTGRYDDAEKVFKFLVMFDHLSQKYWIGLGAVNQVKKDYEKAITCYGYGSFLNLDNPKPQYLAAECFMALGDKVNALSALDALNEYCPTDTDIGREYRAKAAELRKKIEG